VVGASATPATAVGTGASYNPQIVISFSAALATGAAAAIDPLSVFNAATWPPRAVAASLAVDASALRGELVTAGHATDAY